MGKRESVEVEEDKRGRGVNLSTLYTQYDPVDFKKQLTIKFTHKKSTLEMLQCLSKGRVWQSRIPLE